MNHLFGAVVAVVLVVSAAAYVFMPDLALTASEVSAASDAAAPPGRPGGQAGGPPGGGPRGGPGGGNRATVVTLAEVETTPYQTLFRSIGTVEASARVAVQSEVAGRVTDVHFTPGETIEAGAPLVTLDSRSQELELTSARAAYEEQRLAVERYDRLQAANSAAVSDVAVQEARTALELAEIALERATYELERRTITAPIMGTPGLTDIRVGDYVGTGTDIVTISRTSELVVRFELPERATDVLRVGLPVRLTLPSRVGQVLEAVVAAVDTQIDPVTRQIEVEARLDNTEAGLTPGAIANVVVGQENEALPRVPALSVSWGRDGASVWIAEDGAVRSVPVRIVHRADDDFWVEGALASGESIVVEGVQKLRDGARVMTADAVARFGAGGTRPERPATRPSGGSDGEPTVRAPADGVEQPSAEGAPAQVDRPVAQRPAAAGGRVPGQQAGEGGQDG